MYHDTIEWSRGAFILILHEVRASVICGKEEVMEKWVCMICGYIYDPAVGDDEGGIPAGTSFEDLPDDWTCPICGAGKDDFEQA